MQVVAFQATMEMMAENFPGAFSGYKLEVIESHQRNKVDTSGTAKAVVASFQQLGLSFQEVGLAPSCRQARALPHPHICPSYWQGSMLADEGCSAHVQPSCSAPVMLPSAVGTQQLVGVQKDIRKVRDASQQKSEMGVPDAAIGGHAFHTYRLKSPDDSVAFEFQHNVCGRQIYAEGTVDAALFLAQQIKSHSKQKVFNMVDVLRAGNMR